MSTILDRILEVKKEEVRQMYEQGFGYDQHVSQRPIASYSFVDAILHPKRSSALIAEVKKASPSKGLIRESFDPIEIALQYQLAGADCLSVLTDKQFFMGDDHYMAAIKEQVSLPVLRKDFIIDTIQIGQSVALGADAILLIAKALPIELLVQLYKEADAVGLDILIEVANQQELEEVLARITPKIIGINNRDLATFVTSIDVTKSLLPFIPNEVVVISESGIHLSEMVKELEQLGVRGFLIGEHFMRQTNIGQAIKALYAHT
jgi:indole-3-glycerol phosphate synthase